MKRLLITLIFLVGAPWLFTVSLQMLQTSSDKPYSDINFVSPVPNLSGARIFAALPDNPGETNIQITAGDARETILQRYLYKFDTPLANYTNEIISAADEYDLDFRLLVAIARQESNLCKYIPEGGHNCWGWGIHARGTLGFENYQQAIWTVSKGLRENYLDDGLTTPESIMTRYTPSSNGSWAYAVRLFMEEME